MNKEIVEVLQKEKPHFYMMDLNNYNEEFLKQIIEWQYQMIEAYKEKDSSSTKKGCGSMFCSVEGCGRIDHSNSAYCPEHHRSLHFVCGGNGLCEKCRSSTFCEPSEEESEQ